MDDTLTPVFKHALLFMGSALGISFIIAYFLDFLTGFIASIAFFIGTIFYIRRK